MRLKYENLQQVAQSLERGDQLSGEDVHEILLKLVNEQISSSYIVFWVGSQTSAIMETVFHSAEKAIKVAEDLPDVQQAWVLRVGVDKLEQIHEHKAPELAGVCGCLEGNRCCNCNAASDHLEQFLGHLMCPACVYVSERKNGKR